ncbi:hypothetical protein B566_EDAN017098 [Ephemera danica]|nr:hypothetical protein B566_EDAN017098 [Ephemera danica]
MPLMNGFDPKKPAVMLRGPIGINLKPFLLLFAEYLADSGHDVMYITKSMSHIPLPLHGTTNKTEAFARINFRCTPRPC